MSELKTLTIESIRTDGGTQTRCRLDTALMREYAQAMAQGAEFPPLEVVFDGADYWLCDGFHRLHAARRSGRADLPAVVHAGSLKDAVWRALTANATHGLRRTTADKAKTVRMALRTHPKMTDRAIAEHVGVSHHTVIKHRERMASQGQVEDLDTRIGLNGKRYAAPRRPAGAQSTALSGHVPDSDPYLFVDAAGRLLEGPHAQKLRMAFANRQTIGKLVLLVRQILTEVKSQMSEPTFQYLPLESFSAGICLVDCCLRSIMPHLPCPQCQGAGCPACEQRGWLDEWNCTHPTEPPQQPTTSTPDATAVPAG